MRNLVYDNLKKYVELEPKEGNLSAGFRVINIIFHGFRQSELGNIKINNKKQVITMQDFRFFTSHFPFADFGPDDTKTLLSVCFKNNDEKTIIQW